MKKDDGDRLTNHGATRSFSFPATTMYMPCMFFSEASNEHLCVHSVTIHAGVDGPEYLLLVSQG